jgi:hypothetical protein
MFDRISDLLHAPQGRPAARRGQTLLGVPMTWKDCALATGRGTDAAADLRQSLEIFQRIGAAEASSVRPSLTPSASLNSRAANPTSDNQELYPTVTAGLVNQPCISPGM